jgi:outer membrane protein assembly factor BamD (BamD/ComL family)
MRNWRGAGTRTGLALLGALVMAGGCAAPEGAAAGPGANAAAARPAAPMKAREVREAVNAAYAAFERKQYDEAMAGAERILAGNPQGAGAAEAQYLRGRVLEERSRAAAAGGNVAAARSAMQSARDAYNAALLLSPAPQLEGDIRTQIANVAYHQEDYATAVAQWSAAYDKVTEPDAKAWVLYRLGLSQQRFGKFTDADRTFAAVQQQFPHTEQARRAAAHQGARGFHVQVGTFNSPANAEAALKDLRTSGVIGMSLPNPSGQQVVRVGPAPTYEQAKALRARLAGKYPDAIIVP